MSFFEILLVIISSAGLLHSFFIATYLLNSKSKKEIANVLLAIILIAIGIRVGKSVMLNFVAHFEFKFILIGLSILLFIGPLLLEYIKAMTIPKYKFQKKMLSQLLPFLVLFLSSFFLSEAIFKKATYGLAIFGSILCGSYVHLAVYFFTSWRMIDKLKKQLPIQNRTKTQQYIIDWLQILLYGFIIIWISYVLNILEDAIPYIIGPILYSIVVYFLSIKAYQYKILNFNGDAFLVDDEENTLFLKLVKNISEEKMYLQPDITLNIISKKIGSTSQKTSAIINKYAQKNFNDFINSYRINAARELLVNDNKKQFTISSIAFDVGFNSLSSFNIAFKKFEGITPSQYRKNNTLS